MSAAKSHRQLISEAAVRRLATGMRVDFRGPDVLRRVTLHVGPTNSGKTHDAIADLVAAGQGVYAAPLRQLAREVYDTLSKTAPGQVGLLTGEEQRNVSAPILCATAQAAPMVGHTLVLDEAHWVHDRHHGHVWTRLLTCGRYEALSIVASDHARSALLALLPDGPAPTVVEHRRLADITYEGQIDLGTVPSSTAIVAFSRKSVLALAQRLREAGREPAVLYGALPHATRTSQLAKFAASSDPLLVTTDVIGHGVNLPLSNVVFAETHKYDGTKLRPLHLWEAAQIAGRAGRFRLGGQGRVHLLAGHQAGPGTRLDMKEVVEAAAGYRIPPAVAAAPALAPELSELGCTHPAQLLLRETHLGWAEAVARQRNGRRLQGAFTAQTLKRLVELQQSRQLTQLRVEDAWRLAQTPLDHPLAQVEVLKAMLGTYPRQIKMLADNPSLAARAVPHLDQLLDRAAGLDSRELEALEAAARLARTLATVAMTFPDLAPFSAQDAQAVEETLSGRIHEALGAIHRPADAR